MQLDTATEACLPAGLRGLHVRMPRMTGTCPARIAALENADGSTVMNAARRRLYSDLVAQLGRYGLQIGVRLSKGGLHA